MSWLEFYKIITGPVNLIATPVILFLEKSSNTPETWRQRRGLLPERVLKQAPFDLWIHGASVGEMAALKAIVARVIETRPHTKVLVSSFTSSGALQAQKAFGKNFPIIQLPIDYPRATRLVASAISPGIFCTVETELWPNLLFSLKRAGSKLLLLNGRISERSFRSYRKIRFFLKDLLRSFDLICTITSTDRNRLLYLGAEAKKIRVCGNAKYEDLLLKADPKEAEKIAQRLGLTSIEKPIIVAGSIRGDEYRLIHQAVTRLRQDGLDPFTVVVPRHLERIRELERFFKDRKEPFQLSSHILTDGPTTIYDNCSFLIVDQIGLLFHLYHCCQIAFVGGSLLPFGGQNIMEPAAWEKPVIFGPHVNNFQEAADRLVRLGGGRMVKNDTELYLELKKFLTDDLLGRKTGKMAKKALEKLGKGAASVQAQKILELLS